MALYEYDQYLARSDHQSFDQEFTLGAQTLHSGIYRCMGCGREVVSEDRKPLPPQNHHQHDTHQGTIRWRMIVYADHNLK
jgi:hypothetical protein